MLRHVALRVQSHITLDFLLPRSAFHVRTIGTLYKSSNPIPSFVSGQIKTLETIEALNQMRPLPESVDSLSKLDVDWFNTSIPHICNALEGQKVLKAYNIWSAISRKGFLSLLGPAHLDMCSRALVNLCEQWSTDIVQPSPEDQRYIEEMAIYIALGGYPNPLSEYLIYQIRRNDPERVHQVYAEYRSQLQVQSELQAEEGEINVADDDGWASNITSSFSTAQANDTHRSSSSEDIHDVKEELHHLPFVPSQILCAEITAYAMQDRFKDALAAMLQTRTRLVNYLVLPFLARLKPDINLRRKLSAYVSRLELGRLLSRPKSFATQLSNLSKGRSDKNLERLYSQFKAELSASDRWLTLDPANANGRALVVVPQFVWASFLTAFLKTRRLDLAEQLWDDISKLGVNPDVTIWNALLNAYAEASPTIAERVAPAWDAMLSQGVKPEPLTYRALIQGLFYCSRPLEAMKRFEEFRGSIHRMCNAEPSTIQLVYNTTVHGLLSNRMEPQARTLLQRMQDDGPHPDIVTFNTFMGYYERTGDMKALASILQSIDSLGLVGDIFTFSTLLRALLKVRDDAVDIVFNLMKKQGVKPNTALYTGIIDHLLRQEKIANFKTALTLLSRMEHSDDKDVAPNEVTYTNLLSRILEATWLDASTIDECQKDILQRMKERNIKPTRAMYNILLRSSLNNPDPRGVHRALLYFKEMMSRKALMAHDSWWVMLYGLARRKEWEVAHQLVAELQVSGFEMTISLENLVNRIRAEWRAQNRSTNMF